MRENENPPAEFNVNLVTAFSAVLKDDAKTYEESIEDVNLNITYTQLKSHLSHDDKLLLDSILDSTLSIAEIKLKPLLKPLYGDKSNTLIKVKVIYPMIKLGLVAQTHPETPRHPRQKYYLTDLGKALQKYLKEIEGTTITNISLLTDRGIPAEHFYKKNGFEEIERLVFLSKGI